MLQTKLTYRHYLESLEQGNPFALSRWGDGEWLATLGAGPRDKANVDGTKYTDYLKDALRHTLLNAHKPPFFYGMLNIARTHLGPRINNWLNREGVLIDWVDGDVLLNVSLAGDLFPFVKQVRRKKSAVYVGPEYLRRTIYHFFPNAKFIVIPESTAFDVRLAIIKEVNRHERDIALFSAGMASNVVMHELWAQHEGKMTLIDCGSMFDGYAGVKNRSYIKQHDFDRLKQVNMGLRVKESGERFKNGDKKPE